MSNFDESATCSVCHRARQCVFTSGPLEGFCQRCAWDFDTRRLEIEQMESAGRSHAAEPEDAEGMQLSPSAFTSKEVTP